MSTHDYYYIRAKVDPRAASVDRLGDYVDNIRAVRRKERIGPQKSVAEVPLAEDGGDLLVDVISNPSDALIVSDKVLAALSEEGVLSSDVEIVPLKILDRRGRPVPKGYAIVNPLRTIDCLDVSRSNAVVHKGKVLSLYAIQIHADKIPDDARLFRIGEFPSYVLLRGDLVQVLQSKGLEGLRAAAMGENVYE